MITLKQLTDRQIFTQEDDGALIAEWFQENDMAVEGIDIISKIAKKEINNLKYNYGKIMGNLSIYAGNETLIKEFGIKNGSHFDRIVRLFIMQYNLVENYPAEMEWLKGFVPQNDLPVIFWQPFLKFLHENNIYFKNEVKDANG